MHIRVSIKNLMMMMIVMGLLGAVFEARSKGDCNEALIYLAERHTLNYYNVSRGIGDYHDIFGKTFFLDKLLKLKKDDTWIDMGAGKAKAQSAYYFAGTPGAKLVKATDSYQKTLEVSPDYQVIDAISSIPQHERANLVALSVRKPNFSEAEISFGKTSNDATVDKKKFKYLEGRYFEDIPIEEISRAKMITDVYGPFSYTNKLDEVLQKYMRILSRDGIAFIGFMDVTYVINEAGLKVPLIDWLKSLDGIRVEVLDRTVLNTRKKDHIEWGISISRTNPNFKFPRLRLVEIKDEAPPDRIFEVVAN